MGDRYLTKLINFDRDLVLILTLHHMNRAVNDGYAYNKTSGHVAIIW